MTLDVELYRRTLYLTSSDGDKALRRVSVIDIQPDVAPDTPARTLVFVHGYGGRNLQWLYQLRTFGQTMRVIAPDLRGHGQSDDPARPPITVETLVDDLEATLAQLETQRPFLLVAHSFGGAIAAEYALRHPEEVSGLVLIGTPARFILTPGARQLMSLPGPVIETLKKRLGIAIFADARTMRRMHDGAMSRWRGDKRLGELRVPTLVVIGHRDTVFTQEHYAAVPKLIPGAQQVVIPVSAHLVQLERPDAVNRAIRRFVQARARMEANSSVDAMGSFPQPRAASASLRLGEAPWLQAYDPDVPEEIPTPQVLAHDFLSNSAAEFPDRTALHFFGQKISYRELDLLSNRCARALRGLGLQRGDRVAVILPNVPQCVIAFYGVLKAGGVVVLGSPLSNEEEIAFQIRDSDARIALTLNTYRSMLERIAAQSPALERLIFTDVREYLPLRQRLAVALGPSPAPPNNSAASQNGAALSALPHHDFQQLLRAAASAPLLGETQCDDLALLQYTSGTTDAPRGVMLSHQNLVVNVAQQRHWLNDAKRGGETILGVLPLSHSYGVTGCMNLAMALAASLVLMPTNRTEEILNAIKRYHPTIFPGVPTIYLAVANFPHVRRYGVASIRVCVSGSAPLPVEVQESFEKLTRGRLVEGYGLTEASPVTHSNPLKGERRVGSIGVPMPSTSARIVDLQTGEPLPQGEVGELEVRGPQVMQGYWKRPDETAQALRDGWLRTGDLASMDEDGYFTIVDRKKDLIIAGQYNVYPRDVEEVLYESPKVFEAVVVSGRDGANGDNPFVKAIVVLKRGERATAEELLALCRERLEAYKVPKQIEFRTELPKNLVGKVLRRLLVEA
ncbi:MAG TPA: alpha/beta fold hydrolase [Ktedonobacterales bacterium]|jgi:long-chain acyl-CoA synthetase|nr:alpha/beta fold hydrolase [Ktedonobacterales bacterium]